MILYASDFRKLGSNHSLMHCRDKFMEFFHDRKLTIVAPSAEHFDEWIPEIPTFRVFTIKNDDGLSSHGWVVLLHENHEREHFLNGP